MAGIGTIIRKQKVIQTFMMNEERLKQILDAEEQAQTLYESTMQEADSLPEQAERRVQDLLEVTRQKAELDSARLTEEIINPTIIDEIINEYAERTSHRDALAQINLPKAVDYIVQALLGTTQKA